MDRSSDGAGAFVRRHQAGLWRFLRSAGCDPATAEDLVQDALLEALRKGMQHRPDPTAGAFLRTAARNLWLRRHRDERRRLERVLDLAEQLWRRDCAADAGSALMEALDRCVASLPERSRRVLRRVYAEGASRSELARELGIGAHGVRSLLQRLRSTLRDCIERRIT